MIIGERVQARMEALSLNQSELARRVGVAQPTIYKLIRANKIGSKHLHKIARELKTTPAYLEGETDDADAGAPAPAPELMVQHVMLPVALPSEAALAQMFEALLAGLPAKATRDEQALLLARRLPIGLSQTRDLLPSRPTPTRAPAKAGRSRQKEPQL